METPPGNGGSVCGSARGSALWLDGEGVFEFLHPHLQILDFSPLLLDEQGFNPAQSRFDNSKPRLNGIESRVIVGKPLADHQSQFLKGDVPPVF
jgi:hypothetical protein